MDEEKNQVIRNTDTCEKRKENKKCNLFFRCDWKINYSSYFLNQNKNMLYKHANGVYRKPKHHSNTLCGEGGTISQTQISAIVRSSHQITNCAHPITSFGTVRV